jgi:hypothetical protein
MQKSIRFDEVKTGNKVYQSGYYARDKWRKVTKITTSLTTVSLYLGTSAHKTIDTRTQLVGHPAEGIMVILD